MIHKPCGCLARLSKNLLLLQKSTFGIKATEEHEWTAAQIAAFAKLEGERVAAEITIGAATYKSNVWIFPNRFFGITRALLTATIGFGEITEANPADSTLFEVSFSILNMCILTHIGYFVRGSTSARWIGGAILQDEEWIIEIRQSPHYDSAEKYLRSVGGFQVTHIGTMRRSDGGSFSPAEAKAQLRSLRYFLSFANGSWVSMMRVLSVNEHWETCWQHWNDYPAEWSSGHKNCSWLSIRGDFDIEEPNALAEVFPTFNKAIKEREETTLTIERYLIGNVAHPFVDPVGGRIAGEMAAVILAGAKSSPWRQLEKDLSAAGASLSIPAELTNLQALYDRNLAKWRKDPTPLKPGPRILRALRDRFEHPENRLRGMGESYAQQAFYEAWHLSQWYLETLILHDIGYEGPRANRARNTRWETVS